MLARFEFTQTSVKAFGARPDKGKRLYVYCTTEKGLGLSITPTGRKTFFYHGRVNGRPDRVPLGRFPETSVKLAKSRCIRVRAAIEDGRNPRLDLAAAARPRGDTTLGEFFEIWYARHAVRKRRRPHLARRDFELYCSEISGVALRRLNHAIVMAWHADIGRRNGEPTANKALGLVSAICSKAMIWDSPAGGKYITGNPASRRLVERFDEASRDRFMSRDEIRRFWRTVTVFEPPSGGHFFQLALCTAQRKATIMSMKYENIDMKSGNWIVPTLKGGKTNHPVPLCRIAQEIIKMRRLLSHSPWVFPGRRRGGTHIKNVDFWWAAICDEAALTNLRIHDIRRTTASYMAMSGASTEIIAQLLAHTRPGPTQIYARLDVLPIRLAIERALREMAIEGRRAISNTRSTGGNR